MRPSRLVSIIPLALLAIPAAASAAFPHTILPGESLYSIAAADGLSVSELAAANGLSPNGQLTAGSTLLIPPQGGTVGSTAGSSTSTISTAPAAGNDGDDDDAGATTTGTAVPVSTTPSTGAGSYVVQPGDTLSAIAARAGTTVSSLAASNGLDPAGTLPAGLALRLSPTTLESSAPTQAPAVGTTITGKMTWFGGSHDPGAQGAPASGLGWRSDGMSFYNYGSLGHRWLIRFPWGQTLNMSQIDIGPAPWTGNPFDIAFSALPNTPYSWRTWPNPVVTGIYQGG